MYNTPDQGPENHLGEDNEKLFQKKRAASAPPPKSTPGQRPAGAAPRVYTAKPTAQEHAPAYANRRSGGQDNGKANSATDPSTAPTVKIRTAGNPATAAPVHKPAPEISVKQKAVPVSSPLKAAPHQGDTPAYAGRRAAENAGAPAPSQPPPTSDAKDKKSGLSRLGADMMANSVKAIT